MAVDTFKHSAIQGILALGKNSAKKLYFYVLRGLLMAHPLCDFYCPVNKTTFFKRIALYEITKYKDLLYITFLLPMYYIAPIYIQRCQQHQYASIITTIHYCLTDRKLRYAL